MKRFLGLIRNGTKNIALKFGIEVIESCQICGIEQPLVWWADNNVYLEITGDRTTIFCPKCFDNLADKKGILLMWEPKIEQRERRDKCRRT